jgi:DNA-binding NarL/FixJ family response regulator
VYLVDDHPMLRQGFTYVINLAPDLKVCGEADNGEIALKAVAALKPDLVILEVGLREGNGLDLIKRLKISHPQVPVLVLSIRDETVFAQRCLRAGARGYVMKQAPTEEVMEAIRRVLQGGRYVSGRVQERMLENLSNGSEDGATPGIERLSDRELEVFRLVGQGCGTRQIAEQLQLSIKTIETYRAHIKEKLKLRSATDLIRSAVKIASQEESF